jgi:hypothetical protein
MLLHMARTTLTIDDQLFRELKRKAAQEGRTFQSLANDYLRRSLRAPRPDRYKLQLRGWKADQQPGVDLMDRDALFDLMDGR